MAQTLVNHPDGTTLLTVAIPTDKVPLIREAFAEEYNWTVEIGVTKIQFFKQQVIDYIRQVTRNNLANKDAQAARASKEAEINAVNIT